MKISQVRIGGTYWTKIGSERVQVRVVCPAPQPSCGPRRGVTRFSCERVDTGRMLTKWRTAASLHPDKSGASWARPLKSFAKRAASGSASHAGGHGHGGRKLSEEEKFRYRLHPMRRPEPIRKGIQQIRHVPAKNKHQRGMFAEPAPTTRELLRASAKKHGRHGYGYFDQEAFEAAEAEGGYHDRFGRPLVQRVSDEYFTGTMPTGTPWKKWMPKPKIPQGLTASQEEWLATGKNPHHKDVVLPAELAALARKDAEAAALVAEAARVAAARERAERAASRPKKSNEKFPEGSLAWTKVGEQRVQVRILQVRQSPPRVGGSKWRKEYYVARVDTGRPLPSMRSARQLHESGAGYWAGMTEAREVNGEAAERIAREVAIRETNPQRVATRGSRAEKALQKRAEERAAPKISYILPPPSKRRGWKTGSLRKRPKLERSGMLFTPSAREVLLRTGREHSRRGWAKGKKRGPNTHPDDMPENSALEDLVRMGEKGEPREWRVPAKLTDAEKKWLKKHKERIENRRDPKRKR